MKLVKTFFKKNTFLTSIGVLTGLTGLIISFAMLFVTPDEPIDPRFSDQKVNVVNYSLYRNDLRKRITLLSHENDELLSRINQLKLVIRDSVDSNHYSTNTSMTKLKMFDIYVENELKTIREKGLKNLSSRLSDLETVIMDNPNKALELPLIRKDLVSLSENYEYKLEVLGNEINRVHSQNNWFIGLLFTLAIGVLSLVGNNIVQSNKKEKRKVQEGDSEQRIDTEKET